MFALSYVTRCHISPHSVENVSARYFTNLIILHLTYYLHRQLRPIIWPSGNILDLSQSKHPVNNLPKHNMLSVQVRRLHRSDEELTAVRAGSSIGHAQQERLLMLELKVLVLELLAVDGLATSAVALQNCQSF